MRSQDNLHNTVLSPLPYQEIAEKNTKIQIGLTFACTQNNIEQVGTSHGKFDGSVAALMLIIGQEAGVMTESRSLLYFKSPGADDGLTAVMQRRGWNVRVATYPEAAIEALCEETFRVGLVHWDRNDVDMPTMRQQAEQLLDASNCVNWVALLSDASNKVNALSRVISTYFYDYHTIPVDADRLLVTLGHAYGMAKIATCDAESHEDLSVNSHMVGSNKAMQGLFKKIAKVASIDLNALIRGESGTGKELTAQAIHRSSNRKNGPFVAVNCGTLPKDLIQAELFGHEKGAFTGADRRRVGRIEAAQNGTLFLDEIGDLPLELQINLLRFLQEKKIGRIGNPNEFTVDVRVIAATNVNLERAVEDGVFREDLYYRLNVLHLEMPPLRERGLDIELLAHHFFRQFSGNLRPNVKGFSKQAIDAINAHSWPGNVREMMNRVQSAVVMCEGRLIKPRDLGLDRDAPNNSLMTLAEARKQAEKDIIEYTLSAVRNNVSKAARRLDVSRVTLYRLMELHAIDWQGAKHS